MARFSDEEVRRYSRQILLREVGGRGQERLQKAQPALLPRGTVGRVAAAYLQRAGVTQLQLLPCADAGPTLLRLEDAVLWASCDGLIGEVGGGPPPDAAAGSGRGEAAWATGSLLALEGLKLILGIPCVAGRRLRIDLSGDGVPA